MSFGSIANWGEKIKSSGDRLYPIILVLSLGFCGWAVWHLISASGASKSLQIEGIPVAGGLIDPMAVNRSKSAGQNVSAKLASPDPSSNLALGAFVASKQGSKYYPADCASAKRIKDVNKIYFNTAEEATAAGYELTVMCK